MPEVEKICLPESGCFCRMRIIKCGLSSVASGDASIAFFAAVAQRLHETKVAAHLLCKAWLLETFDRGDALPAGQGALESLFQDAVRVIGGVRKTHLQRGLGALHEALFPAGFRDVVDITGAKNWPGYAATLTRIRT